MKEIKIEHGNKSRLAKVFGISQLTLRRALRFQKLGDEILAAKIRKLALEFGGVEMSAEKERVIKL
jgi:hypothetical protein